VRVEYLGETADEPEFLVSCFESWRLDADDKTDNGIDDASADDAMRDSAIKLEI
jgi:hypothetical protein